MSGELVPMLVSFLLTLMVFSYILRDNPLFRLAVHLLIGVAAGYAGAVVWNGVILPQMIGPFYRAFSGGGLDSLFLALPPLLLGLLLLGKLSDRLAWIGSRTMAFLVGVGADPQVFVIIHKKELKIIFIYFKSSKLLKRIWI